jgi:hypothetical protein
VHIKPQEAGLRDEIEPGLTFVVFCAASSLPFIRHVNLSHNRCGDRCAEAVASMLDKNSVYLKDIDLTETGITQTGASKLFAKLKALGPNFL